MRPLQRLVGGAVTMGEICMRCGASKCYGQVKDKGAGYDKEYCCYGQHVDEYPFDDDGDDDDEWEEYDEQEEVEGERES